MGKSELAGTAFTEVDQYLEQIQDPQGQDIEEEKAYVRMVITTVLFQGNGGLQELLEKVFISSEEALAVIQNREKNIGECLKSYIPEPEKFPVALKLAKNVVEWIKIKITQWFTGPLGMGQYTQGEIRLFRAIAEKVDEGRAVILSTRKDIYNSADEINGTREGTGESMVKGLAGPHAYTVLDYAPKGGDLRQEERKIRRVKLRNPWGNYGRVYKYKPSLFRRRRDVDMEHQDEPVRIVAREARDDGEFWIDLADVAAYFTSFSYDTDTDAGNP